MRVIIDLDDSYDDVLSFTAAGWRPNGQDVTVACINLMEHDYARIDERGVLSFGPKEYES